MTSLVSYLLTLEQQEATGLLNTRTRGNRFVFLPLARLLLLSAQLRIYYNSALLGPALDL